MKNVIVVGVGEVGKAISRIEQDAGNTVYHVDRDGITTLDDKVAETFPERFDVMHVNIPAIPEFSSTVRKYSDRYNPNLIIINSTLPVGATRRFADTTSIPVVHSPIRGIHPNLYEGIKTFVKYVGGYPEATEVAINHFNSLGLKSFDAGNSETTELLKLLDTTYYLNNIWFAGQAKAACDAAGVDYNVVYKHANESYNDGYAHLGMSHVVRPVLTPPKDGVGGHCCIENAIILEESKLGDFNHLLKLGKKYDGDKLNHRPWLYCEARAKMKHSEGIAKKLGVSEEEVTDALKRHKIFG